MQGEEDEPSLDLERLDRANSLIWVRVSPPTILAEITVRLHQVPDTYPPPGDGRSCLLPYTVEFLTVAEPE